MRISERKKKIAGFLKKYWILIWLTVASLTLVSISIIAIAAYKDANNKIKRVIAPAAGSDGLFTSNYLSLGQNNIKPAYFNEDPNNSYSYTVDIRNYNPVDPSAIYNGTINYSLKVELVKSNETPYDKTTDSEALAEMVSHNQKITISFGGDSFELNGTADGSHLNHLFDGHSLRGKGSGGTNTWTVKYDNIPLGSNYCVKFTAHATNQDLEDIYSTVIVTSYPTVRPQGWSCELVEASSKKTIDHFDGFNYTISGTGAKTIKFSYDSTKLTINPANCNFEISQPGSYSGGESHGIPSDWRTVTISANPDSTGVNRYDIQMFKTSLFNAQDPPITYDEINPNKEKKYVEFKTE